MSLTVSVAIVVSVFPSHSFNSQEIAEGKGPLEVVASAFVVGSQKAKDTENVSSSTMETGGCVVNLTSKLETTIALL